MVMRIVENNDSRKIRESNQCVMQHSDDFIMPCAKLVKFGKLVRLCSYFFKPKIPFFDLGAKAGLF
jgi:hypothetical protein